MRKAQTPQMRAGVRTPGWRADRAWRLDDIDYAGADRARATDDETLFQMLTMASFVETGSDLYAHNLV
ncbi:MAG: hypothetical protein ACREYB_13860, partial [Casimicrobiaceae bacterium]